MPPHAYRTYAQTLSRIGGISVATLGATVLVGWWFDIQFLKEVLPGLATMKFNTGLCFLAAGTAVALLDDSQATNRRLPIRVLASFVLVVSIATIAQYVIGTSFGIDELFQLDDPNTAATSEPGRMAPGTAFSFTFIGFALLAASRASRKLTRRLAAVSLVVSLLAVIGYAYGVRDLYQIAPFQSMALHTAVGFLVLSISLVAADTSDGFMEILVSDSAGGRTARGLLPFTTVVLVVIGWIRLSGERAGFYGATFGVTLMVVAATTVTSVAVIWEAYRLHNADMMRRGAEAELRALTESLEVRVEERTAELRQALAEVKQLTGLLPICAWCKNIRDDQNYWHTVEEYLASHSDAQFTHGMCPTCYAKMLEDPALADEQAPTRASSSHRVRQVSASSGEPVPTALHAAPAGPPGERPV